MSYLIKHRGNWGFTLKNTGGFISPSILIPCFLFLFLLHAVSVVAAPLGVGPDTVYIVISEDDPEPEEYMLSIYDSDANGGNFTWEAWSDQGWITLPESSDGNVTHSDSITLTIDPIGKSVGTYTGTVSVNATQGAYSVLQTIDVTLEIELAKSGDLGVSPLNLEFAAKKSEPPPVQSLRVFNSTDEYDEFVWSAVASDWWILLYDGHSCDSGSSCGFSPTTSISCNSIGCQCFDVSIDSENMQPGDYNGTITIYSNLEDNSTAIINVTAKVERYETREFEESLSTSSWLDLRLQIPQNDLLDENGNPGNFYLLVEHPSLFPGQVYAYRCLEKEGRGEAECGQETDCRLDLFSQWGHLVSDAEDLAYQSDREWDLQQDMLTVPFGGFRLIGLEGDIIIHGMVGIPKPGGDWGMTRLLKYTLHVVPLTGTWIVTDEFMGQTFTYPEPLILYESRGYLEGAWRNVWLGWWDPSNNINYVNSSDVIPGPVSIDGSRIVVLNSSVVSGYDLRFTEWSPLSKQNFEYWYQITHLSQGSMQGFWSYRAAGENIWFTPQAFSAVQQGVTIPLNPDCNCYRVNGTVNGYAIPFLVDTGAFAVLLDLNDAYYLGLVDNETGGLNSKCDQTPVLIGGVGGTITAYKCYVDIEIEGRLSRENVEVYLSEGQSALLGMTFLDQFHISTNAEDGTMTIAP